MTIKDIYLLAHAAAVKLEANLGPVNLLNAKLAAWESALAIPDNTLTDADFPAFEAHLEEAYRKITRLAGMPADSTILANQNAQKTARLEQLKRQQQAQAKPAAAAAPAKANTTPAPVGTPTVPAEPAASQAAHPLAAEVTPAKAA